MKKLNKPILVLAAAVSFLLGACDSDKFPGEPEVKDNVSFALDIQPILTAEQIATLEISTEKTPFDGDILSSRLSYSRVKVTELVRPFAVATGKRTGSARSLKVM